MKRFVLAVLLSIGLPALAASPDDRQMVLKTTAVSGGTATGSAPALADFVFNVGHGSTFVRGTALSLDGIEGVRVELCAASGQTLSGAGQLDVYLLNPQGEVLHNKELSATLAVGLSATSCTGALCRCRVWPDFPVWASAAGGGMMAIPNGVTVSGGATVTVRIHAVSFQSR